MANAFLTALWNLVEDPKMQQWIHWNRAGNGFVVPNPAAFEAHACELLLGEAGENILARGHWRARVSRGAAGPATACRPGRSPAPPARRPGVL